MEEHEIMQLLWNRAEGAIDALAQAFGHHLYATAMDILGCHEDAEETVSDTYLAVWNAIPPKRPVPLSGFVLKTGRNIALNRLRYQTAEKRDSRYDASLEELADCLQGAGLQEQLDARALRRAINAYLGTTSNESRVIFLRRYWFGDSIKDIAASRSMTEDAVALRLARIREGLQNYLMEEEFIHEKPQAD